MFCKLSLISIWQQRVFGVVFLKQLSIYFRKQLFAVVYLITKAISN